MKGRRRQLGSISGRREGALERLEDRVQTHHYREIVQCPTPSECQDPCQTDHNRKRNKALAEIANLKKKLGRLFS